MGLRGCTTDGASHSRLGSEFGEHEVPTGAESVSVTSIVVSQFSAVLSKLQLKLLSFANLGKNEIHYF